MFDADNSKLYKNKLCESYFPILYNKITINMCYVNGYIRACYIAALYATKHADMY